MQEEHTKDRKLSQLGKGLADRTVNSNVRIPEDQALYIQYYSMLGRTGYTNLRLALLPYGIVFPPYNELKEYKYKEIIPTVMVCKILLCSFGAWSFNQSRL